MKKTGIIVNAALISHSLDIALKAFEENDIGYSGFASDRSNNGSGKLLPVIVIQYFYWKNSDFAINIEVYGERERQNNCNKLPKSKVLFENCTVFVCERTAVQFIENFCMKEEIMCLQS